MGKKQILEILFPPLIMEVLLFPFLFYNNPRHISIAKNCKKNGKYVCVRHFSLELQAVQSDSKTKQKQKKV